MAYDAHDVFFGWLQAKRPDLLPRYEELYSGGRAYMRPEERRKTTRAVRGWGRGRGRRGRTGTVRKDPATNSPPQQEELF